ncbi:MAG: alanine--tRNA ligase [Ignavibacteriales bacterium]|nr:alanine--tRNA ligase [Ignavibacteriales bacterium]
MTSNEIRQQFLDFFKSKDHRIVPSAPVVPHGDPTLLFTNAGMNQFKDVFLGTGSREYKRAADTQKCIRVSGKHNDLEEVGHDTYHHTFFEMLGNWSFGDPPSKDGIGAGYYKKEAIGWAWELLTGVWKLPKERIWATVYRTDDETLKFWKSETDINPKHILKFDEKDNFWEMGEAGPCGPCSEIHINLSDDYENPKYVNAGLPECIEIWNLVFIQYNRDEKGTLHELPAKHVDTGMGFERVCAILQKKNSNYDTDVFTPIIKSVEKLSGVSYKKEEDMISMRVIADHIRTLTFAIADGLEYGIPDALPSNEGRGYVLRRLLRRAAVYAEKINLNEPFLFKLVNVVVQTFGHVFPEIKTNQSNIEKIIKAEEESFNITRDRGIEEYNQVASGSLCRAISEKTPYNAYAIYEFENMDWRIIIDKKDGVNVEKIFFNNINPETLKKYCLDNVVISGDDVFKLKDTYGFPEDLTNMMAREKGFSIDESRFTELIEEQRERARKSTKEKMKTLKMPLSWEIKTIDSTENKIIVPTIFTGYDELRTEAVVENVFPDGNNLLVTLDKTPFYVFGGGQVEDKGYLIVNDRKFYTAVMKNDKTIYHLLINEKKDIVLESGTKVIAEVDKNNRWDIMRNHSATHFLHKALRQILGQHVRQSGSYVGPDGFRFDFTHFEKIKESKLEEIEFLVNEKLRENLPLIHHRDIPFDEAIKMGALMFFGDKYGDKVNVVQFGDFTMEFCGGTHVKNSSQIGLFKIISESSIASGVRRIEAVTGAGVEKYIKEQQLRIENGELRINELHDEKKKLEKQLAEFQLKEKLGGINSIVSSPINVNGINLFKGKVSASNMDELKSMGDELREKMKSGIGVLISQIEDKVGIVAVVSDDLIKEKKILAGNIVKEVAKIVGGSGGGRPHLATAGGKDVEKIDDALQSLEAIVKGF